MIRWALPALAIAAVTIAALRLAAGGAKPPQIRSGPAETPHEGLKLRGAQTHPLWWTSTTRDFDRELAALRGAGANVVRIDLSWSSLERRCKSCFSKSYTARADTFFRHAHARGIKVIPTFHNTPCWASSAPETVKQRCAGQWWDRGVAKYPPREMDDYADAAAWAAKRWGRFMAGFEVWNQPNEVSRNFWNTEDQAGDYVRLAKATYPKLKDAQPSLPVVAGALSFSDGAFTDRLYDLGIKGYFDAFSFHPYSERRPPAYLARDDARKWSFASGVPWIREVMLARGDDKPLWLTEFGWTTCTDVGHRRCVTEDLQGSYTAAAWNMLGRWSYVGAATQYAVRDKGDDPVDPEDRYGLLRRDFRPKPAYRHFKRALSQGRTPARDLP